MHKSIQRSLLPLFIFLTLAGFQGCAGYHTKVESPFGIKTIFVPTVRNIIPLQDMLIYVPGMEVDMTNAVIQRFNFDGSLKVVSRKEDADATLYINLTRFDQEGVRFTNLESVEEYRLFITADIKLKDNKTDETLLKEKNFTGRSSYFRQTSKGNVRNNGQSFREPLQEVLKPATQKTIIDFAHNVVDIITEAW